MKVGGKNVRLNELWGELLEQKPTNDNLRYIIEWVKPLRVKAGQKLLEQKPTNDNLCYIIEYVEPLREKVQKLLNKRSPNEIIKEMRTLL